VSRTGAIASLAAVALAAAGAASAAPPREADGLHDARYCEIIELKGAPPDATAIVWNTIGLNRCPASWWESLDAGELARERGDTAVLLNGPRHFLMDSVTARTGGIRSFHGVRLRKVAAIPIRTAADIAQRPYTDRVVERRNTWRWQKGRVVYELVAPGGDTYVMQSYSQIVDPELTIAELRSLGRRIDPPAGWRYRVRRLRRPLAVAARNGKATIVQDELQNTYQLATTKSRTGPRRRRHVSIEGSTRNVPATTPGTVEDRGTVEGKPFGRGSVTLVGRFAGSRLTGDFRLLFPRGSVSGTVDLPFTIDGNTISFRGTGRFTSGTGIYRGITSGTLEIRDTNTLDGQSGRLFVSGSVKY
jgi:hypothetical protein